jgi:hypothetical protein
VHWIPATSIYAESFRVGEALMTVGQFLTAEGASEYPTEVRYGDHVIHFSPDAAMAAATAIQAWANTNWDLVRRKEAY